MEFQLPIQIPSLPEPIRYGDKILLMGSCFTEHIGNQLHDWKFEVRQNPHGIIFDPYSVASSLVSYIDKRRYVAEDLVFFNELWHSWQHHSVFSGTDREEVLERINGSQSRAHEFLKEAKWLIITLGTSFSYRLSDPSFLHEQSGASIGPSVSLPVANCHRAPARIFTKHLMSIEEIHAALDNCLHRLFHFNPGIQVVFTVSPVRHTRDGVVENNRSKARLIESVHHLVNKFDRIRYFPAYELVIDILRDYRFYDIDMVHPNYQATRFVLEQFTRHFIDETSQQLIEEIKKIVIARKHKPLHPDTLAHSRFLQDYRRKTEELAARYPFIDFGEELAYFST